ncbi:carbohydrate kinase family protein [Methanobacterium paludis]|uniref:Fructokinase n=1 Tax=Methanobacterium paludis (strain DSM 25820 / JCM 18151 / SWAN1) TaxID=868131 RepID=F6D3B9_METPW|nr:carbohydrate kinase family protein [Methanobacterium paludis]AEG18711.1 Fructokinase [Methanobacterium paludis]
MKKFSLDVIGLGTCNADFIMKVPRFVESDDEVDIQELLPSIGGSAANFAVGISRQGLKAGIMTRIGKDHFGRLAVQKFRDEGVDTERLLHINEKTGMAFIAVDSHGERAMYTFMGANAKFYLEKEDIEYIKSSKLLHITGMYKEVVEEASKHANLLSLNPGTLLSSYGLKTLDKIIKKAHIIFLNKKEVKILTGLNFNEGSQTILNMGVPIVVVTCGKSGATVYTENDVISSPTGGVEALDTTGAGDAFAAGFIASFVKDKKLEDCLKMGNIVAAQCVGRLGALK